MRSKILLVSQENCIWCILTEHWRLDFTKAKMATLHEDANLQLSDISKLHIYLFIVCSNAKALISVFLFPAIPSYVWLTEHQELNTTEHQDDGIEVNPAPKDTQASGSTTAHT